ncbi:MAG TPA: hypothetical protein VKA08_11425 [Balneolales bacterium]|nr:hypothetical protein [Balneolales bacterium]
MFPKLCFFLMLLSPFWGGCRNTTDSTKLNVDHDIPPSEDFDAYYGFWGPNGDKIYFQHNEKLGTNPDPGRLDELWELDLKTGKRQMIHSGRILNASISQDGEWFVFHSFSDPEYLYKMRSNGTDLEKLTGPDSPNPDWKYTNVGRWSPDGKQILFTVAAGVPRGISLMDSSGSNAHIIIPYGVGARWFHGGKRIVYVNWDTTQPQGRRRQIYIANVDGSDPQKITDLPHSDYVGEPVSSPDGNKIVFDNVASNNNYELFIMNSDGTEIEQVTEGVGVAGRPQWSPNGKTILFSRFIPNVSRRLYLLDVQTKQVTPVFPAK